MVHSYLYMSVAVAVAVQSAEAPERCLPCLLLHRLIAMLGVLNLEYEGLTGCAGRLE